jgi:uncharacterized protein with von Willebrand factor type A (vWA) domain
LKFNPNFEEIFRSVLSPGWLKAVGNMQKASNNINDNVIKNSMIDKIIYKEKRKAIEQDDDLLNNIEYLGQEKLKTFPALTQDVFNAFYNIKPEIKDDSEISLQAQKFNKHIIIRTMQNDEYLVLKQLTEGCDMESMEATKEFMVNIFDNLDDLLKDTSGEKKTLDVIEKKVNQCKQKQDELKELIEKSKELSGKGKTEQAEVVVKKAIATAKELEKQKKQIEYLEKVVDQNSAKNKEQIEQKILAALKKAINKTEEIKDILDAWGDDDPKHMKTETKKELIEKIRKNDRFREMSKLVGRYRRLARSKLKDSYTYDIGERYSVELGNDLNRVLSSEFAMLANRHSKLIFLKKYAGKQLKQFKKREKRGKGYGNMVICCDESGSMNTGKDFWSKAICCSLLEVALSNNKNFASIHFSSKNKFIVNEINKENYSLKTVMSMACNFLGGGTDFETPLLEAKKLLETDKYKYADLVFITDGECDISDEFLKDFLKTRAEMKFNVIGVLLDKGMGNVSDFTLKKICDIIYKSSEFDEDNIADKILTKIS